MKRIIYFLCALLTTITLSCSETELGSEPVQDCSTVYCTYDLRWIAVKLVDQSGTPIALDRMKVTRVADGEDLTRTYLSEQWNTFRSLGSYTIAGDLDREHIPSFKQTKLRFQGFIDDREVVKADYVVTFDCCHISLVSGDVELTVSR